MTTDTRVRIAISDDHTIFRDGLRHLLESEPGFDVIAEATDGVEALRIAAAHHPDVILLDVAMPRMGGVEALAAMPVAAVRVILLTAAIDSTELLRAIELGARGLVLKDAATRLLIETIRQVVGGKYVISGNVSDDVDGAIATVGRSPSRRYRLTPRELELVAAIVDGDGNRDIANRLGISLQTVKHHLSSIFDKTGVSSRLELALFAVRHGLKTPD